MDRHGFLVFIGIVFILGALVGSCVERVFPSRVRGEVELHNE